MLPGTLNVANTIPVLIQALIFIQIVEVEPITLVSMLLSATAGAVLGAGIVSKLAARRYSVVNKVVSVPNHPKSDEELLIPMPMPSLQRQDS